jgi:hypothetical protein
MGHRRVAAAAALLLVLAGAEAVWAPVPATADNSQQHLVVGLKAFQDGFHDLAAKELRAFLAAAPQDPRRPEVLSILVQADLVRKDWGAARATLEELVRQPGPRAREGRYWLGWLDAQEGQTASALAHLDAYLAQEGGDRRIDALFLAGELAQKLGLPSAAKRYTDFLAGAPKDARRAAAWLGLVQSRTKAEPSAAVTSARQGLQDPVVKGDPAAQEALALAGVEAARAAKDLGAEAGFWHDLGERARDQDLRLRAQYEEGSVLLRSPEPQGARQALEAYLKQAPEGAYAVRAHLLLAGQAREAGDWARALAHLEGVLGRPDDPAVSPQRGELERAALRLALRIGDRERAGRHARAFLAADSSGKPEDQALAHFTLGSLSADPTAAASEWDAVPAGTSRYREARLLAAHSLLGAGRPGEALARLVPLLDAPDPESAVHLTALAAAEAAGDHARVADLCSWLAEHPPPGREPADFLYRRARSLEQGSDEKAYAAALEALAARAPDDPRGGWAAAALAARAADRKDWAGVLRWADRARSGRDPDLATLQEADALAALNRGDEARTALESLAARVGPHQAAALARLGALRDRAGDGPGALEAYRRSLAAGLEGAAAQWVRERMGVLDGSGSGAGQ